MKSGEPGNLPEFFTHFDPRGQGSGETMTTCTYQRFLVSFLTFLICFSVIATASPADNNSGISDSLATADSSRDTLSSLPAITVHATPVRSKPSEYTINDKNLTLHYTDVSAVLQRVSGVTVRSNGGYGSYSELSIRGKSSKNIQIYLDGIPLGTASNASVDIGKLPLNSVSSVTVYKNTLPLSMASSQMGAAVVLRSDSGISSHFSLQTKAGSYGYFDNMGAFTFHTGNTTHYLSGGYITSNNDYLFTHDRGTTLPTSYDPDPTVDDTVLTMNNNFHKSFYGSYTNRYSPSASLQLISQLQYRTSENGLFVYHYVGDQSGSSEKSHVSVREYINFSQSNNHHHALELIYSKQRDTFRDPDGHYSVGGQKEYVSENPSGSISLTSSNQLTTSLGTKLQLKGSTETFSGHSAQSAQSNRTRSVRLTILGGGELSWEQDNVHVRARTSLRMECDSIHSNRNDGSFSSVAKDSLYIYPSVELESALYLSQSMSLTLSAARTQRSPGFTERFGWGNFVHPNPDLKAEQRTEADIGFQITKERWHTSLSLFSGTVQDKIKAIPTSQMDYLLKNFSDVSFYGTEWDWEVRTGLVRLSNNLTLMKNWISDSDEKNWIGNLEPFSPQWQNSFTVALSFEQFELLHSIYAQGSYYRDSYNIEKWSNNRPQLDASIAYTLPFGLTISYMITNYLDIINYDFPDKPKPGTQHYFSANYQYSLKQHKKQ